jgi:D-glycero-D-manno-heptose 1,7-bisphosphate phosphatase
VERKVLSSVSSGIGALFIDRDGTINVEKGYVHRIDDLEYIPGSLEALQLASQHGLALYIVTNQAGIARGLYSEEQFRSFSKAMLDGMARQGITIRDVLYCPHHPEGSVQEYKVDCDCRKPATGLLERAIKADSLSVASAAMIGDKNSDVDAGRKLGMRTYLVRTGYGESERAATAADFVVSDLMAAVKHVIQGSGHQGS